MRKIFRLFNSGVSMSRYQIRKCAWQCINNTRGVWAFTPFKPEDMTAAPSNHCTTTLSTFSSKNQRKTPAMSSARFLPVTSSNVTKCNSSLTPVWTCDRRRVFWPTPTERVVSGQMVLQFHVSLEGKKPNIVSFITGPGTFIVSPKKISQSISLCNICLFFFPFSLWSSASLHTCLFNCRSTWVSPNVLIAPLHACVRQGFDVWLLPLRRRIYKSSVAPHDNQWQTTRISCNLVCIVSQTCQSELEDSKWRTNPFPCWDGLSRPTIFVQFFQKRLSSEWFMQ